MCVEAAVCFAMGLPHGDDPACVSRALRSLKINLNDRGWSSKAARAKGLRRLAVAQLGSRDVLDDSEFVKRVAEMAIRRSVPPALRAAASIQKDSNHRTKLLDAAMRCEKEGTRDAADASAATADVACANANAAAAYDAAVAAYAAANAATYASTANAYAAKKKAPDEALSDFAEGVVQILIEMKAPGCQWLFLTEGV